MSLLGKRKLALGEQSLLTAWAGSADVRLVQSWRSLSLRSSWIRSCMDGMVAVFCLLLYEAIPGVRWLSPDQSATRVETYLRIIR